jgi:hypothetical protein
MTGAIWEASRGTPGGIHDGMDGGGVSCLQDQGSGNARRGPAVRPVDGRCTSGPVAPGRALLACSQASGDRACAGEPAASRNHS